MSQPSRRFTGFRLLEQHVKSHIGRIIVAIILLTSILSGMLLASRSADANVTLQYFEAEAVAGGIALEWKTATEFQTSAFYVKRALDRSDFLPVDNSVTFEADAIEFVDSQGNTVMSIVAEGTNGSGATYNVLDTGDDLIDGQTYWYRLVEIESNNTKIAQIDDDTFATQGEIGTPTPGVTEVGLPTATSAPTNTPTTANTVTPTPAATATSGATATSVATSTSTAAATTASSAAGTATSTPVPPATPTLIPVATANDATDDPGEIGAVPVAEAAGQTSYPGEVTPTPVTPEAYLGDQIPGSIDNNSADSDSTDPTAPAIIGESETASAQLPPPSNSVSNETTSTNRAILWIGFVAALLIFAAGAFGSIIIFTRRRTDES